MKPGGSLLCSQEPVTGSYPVPYALSPYPPIRSFYNIIFAFMPRSSE